MEPYTRTQKHTHTDEQKQFVQSFVHLIARQNDKMNKAQLLKVGTKEKKGIVHRKHLNNRRTHASSNHIQSHSVKQTRIKRKSEIQYEI